MYAQQMAAKMQFEQMRRGLPVGSSGQPQADEEPSPQPGDSGGMYL